ncbi:hypothetical protein NC658_21445 [Streptomyces griseoincarnatus]|uniref:TonB C-terminal domain-containing protein n=1 Tax=Streptomyces griseoincarnatus TaxID=29305 RepID=A0ABT0VWS9_STRGI|nr:hypothetical protein [Streptomyces griseoincarnatus]MCM2515794.1 hypothetical protein [Streptomyces griseoincarnatus]
MRMPVSPRPRSYGWHFPEKGNDRIVLQARIVIENRGDRYVHVEYVGDLVKDVKSRTRPATAQALWPHQRNGVTPNLFLQKEFTIKEL